MKFAVDNIEYQNNNFPMPFSYNMGEQLINLGIQMFSTGIQAINSGKNILLDISKYYSQLNNILNQLNNLINNANMGNIFQPPILMNPGGMMMQNQNPNQVIEYNEYIFTVVFKETTGDKAVIHAKSEMTVEELLNEYLKIRSGFINENAISKFLYCSMELKRNDKRKIKYLLIGSTPTIMVVFSEY
jgi:hypothetical protein